MNHKYKYLAAVSFVLFGAAFICFLVGFRSQSAMMLGSAFLIVSLTLLIGLMTNRALSKDAAERLPAPISRPIVATAAVGVATDSERINGIGSRPLDVDSKMIRPTAAQPDPTDLIVSLIFGSLSIVFLSAGIWIMFFGGRFLFG